MEILFTSSGGLAGSLPPSAEHPLGTTNLGRDIFSQLIYGTRSALLVGVTAAFFVVAVGTLVGLLAGYFGGWVDTVLMRLTDIAFGIPFLLFVIILAAFLEPSIWNIVLAMALVLWRDTGRVIRSQVLSVRERSFIEAARVAGLIALANSLRPRCPQHLAAVVSLRLHRGGLGHPDRSERELLGLR